MFKWSKTSLEKLAMLDSRLLAICNILIRFIDVKVIHTYRGKYTQNTLFECGLSEKRYPNSKHNTKPLSMAVDLVPYPVDWKDRDRFILMAGMFLGIAQMLGISVRWGGDWNMNNVVKDENFQDLGHFELLED